MTAQNKQFLINNIDKVANTNIKLDSELATYSHKYNKSINRQDFSSLPTEVGQELIVYYLRQLGVKNYDNLTVHRLCLALKTAKPNSIHSVKDQTYLDVKTESAVFVTP